MFDLESIPHETVAYYLFFIRLRHRNSVSTDVFLAQIFGFLGSTKSTSFSYLSREIWEPEPCEYLEQQPLLQLVQCNSTIVHSSWTSGTDVPTQNVPPWTHFKDSIKSLQANALRLRLECDADQNSQEGEPAKHEIWA
jgi:hypothetical protein